MSGDVHVQFCEQHWEKFPMLTHLVFIFENPEDARSIFGVLNKRLNKYGLDIHEDKSSMLPSGRKASLRAAAAGTRIPTYKFLGFTCYWDRSLKGYWRPKYTSRQDRFTGTLKDLRKFLWANLNTKNTDELLRSVIRKVKGWVNYHAISDNNRRVSSFVLYVKKMLFKWINRKGGKRRTNWDKLIMRLNRVGFPRSFRTVSMFG